MQEVAVVASREGLLAMVRRMLWEHRWFIGCIAFCAAAGLLVVRSTPAADRVSYGLYSLAIFQVTGIFIVVAAILYPLWVMVAVRPARLTRHLVDDLHTRILVPERLFQGVLVLVTLPPFISVYTSLKRLIPELNPYGWDVTFMEWDRALHGGIDPWILLQPILGRPLVTFAVSFAYQVWVFVMYGVLLWQAFTLVAPRLRMQFLLSYLLLWAVLGNVLATLLASAGPCYYGRVTALPDPFAPLMAYLYAVAEEYRVPALTVQENLWATYVSKGLVPGSGISAMPSLHVATSVLFALVGARRDRRLGIVLWIFAALIMIGSVHLGWHYAVDGYVSILLTVLLWRAVGWALARDPAFADRGASRR